MQKTFKKNVLIMCLLLLLTTGIFAQVRLDLAVNVPFYMGINKDNEAIGTFSQYAFLIPEIDLHYIFDLGTINIGAGAKMFTLIIETIVWPDLLVELELDPIILSVQVGGGAFAVFGIFSDAAASPLILADITAAYKLTDWFRLGLGIFMFGESDPDLPLTDAGFLPFAVYASGKFSLMFKK